MGLERKCKNYFKGRTSGGKFRGQNDALWQNYFDKWQSDLQYTAKQNSVSLLIDYGQCSMWQIVLWNSDLCVLHPR